MKRPILLQLLVPLLVSCAGAAEPPPPDPILVSLYCDLAMAAGESGPAAPDSVRAAIFTRHGTTQSEFEAALGRYRDDPRGWIDFFQAVTDTFDSRITRQYPYRAPTRPAVRPPGTG